MTTYLKERNLLGGEDYPLPSRKSDSRSESGELSTREIGRGAFLYDETLIRAVDNKVVRRPTHEPKTFQATEGKTIYSSNFITPHPSQTETIAYGIAQERDDQRGPGGVEGEHIDLSKLAAALWRDIAFDAAPEYAGYSYMDEFPPLGSGNACHFDHLYDVYIKSTRSTT